MSKKRLSIQADIEEIKKGLSKNEKYSQAIRLHAVYQVAKGKPIQEVSDMYNVSEKAIYNWVHRYNAEGLKGLCDRPHSGRPSRLSITQKEILRQTIKDKPEKEGYPSGTWTGAMAISYIAKTFGVVYKRAQIYNLLHELGFSFQRGRGYYPEKQGREEKVEEIKKKLQSLDSESVVVYEDEASVSNTATVSYAWSEIGIQPRIEVPQRRKERRTIFGCVNTKTGEFIEQVSERGNTRTFFSLLLKVANANKGKKVYMIVDNVRFHHAKRLKPILERYSHIMELIFLPPYSPDLNPVERVWWLMRKKVTHNRGIKTMDERINDFYYWCRNTSPSDIITICN
jgi:putative transposase